VLKRHYHCENNELVELSVLRYKEQEVYYFVETLMPRAIQIRQTGGPEVLNWTPVESGEPRDLAPLPTEPYVQHPAATQESM
jgi:hypothetical protein